MPPAASIALAAAVLAVCMVALRRFLSAELFYAAMHDNLPRVRLLLRLGADPNGSVGARSVLEQARSPAVARILLEAGAQRGRAEALCDAAMFGQVELVRALIAGGVDPNERSKGGRVPLIAALTTYTTDTILYDPSPETSWERARERRAAIVGTFLDAGADPNGSSDEGDRPLIYAISFRGEAELCRMLLDHGAAVDAPNRIGLTPLMYAAVCGSCDIARMLLDRGADVNARGDCGYTPLYCAASTSGSDDVVELLLEYGADSDA